MKSISKKALISTKGIKSTLIIIFIIIAPILININLLSASNYSQDLKKIENEKSIINLKTSQSQILSWWNESWNYRVRIDVTAINRTVTDVPINKRINFTSLLHTLNDYNRLIWNSIRVVEYNISLESWTETNCTVYEYVGTTAATDYNDLTNAVVDITWIMQGTTLENDTRLYYIYFDSEANTFIFPERDYGFNQAGAYGSYGTKNLIYGDYFRLADFSASSYDLTYREGTSHYGNANNPFDNVYGNDPRVYDDILAIALEIEGQKSAKLLPKLIEYGILLGWYSS